MGIVFTRLFSSVFGNREARILVLGLDNAGKITILYRLQMGEVVSTIPTAVSDGGSDVALCSVRCFRPDPVCGADEVTYWCGCLEAACAGVRVARRGYCEVGAGSAPVSGQALLLVHIVWLFVLGAAVLFGFL